MLPNAEHEDKGKTLLTYQDLAIKLNCSIATVYRVVKANSIPKYRVGQKTIRFDWDDVVRCLRDGSSRAHGIDLPGLD